MRMNKEASLNAPIMGLFGITNIFIKDNPLLL